LINFIAAVRSGLLYIYILYMKTPITELPLNPFDQGKDPKEVMKDLLKHSKPISRAQALQGMKEAVEAQKKKAGR
jgi:hypothetical protein